MPNVMPIKAKAGAGLLVAALSLGATLGMANIAVAQEDSSTTTVEESSDPTTVDDSTDTEAPDSETSDESGRDRSQSGGEECEDRADAETSSV
jgi:hypothetical protein